MFCCCNIIVILVLANLYLIIMVEFFEQPVVALAGVAALVFAALLLFRVYSKVMSRVR